MSIKKYLKNISYFRILLDVVMEYSAINMVILLGTQHKDAIMNSTVLEFYVLAAGIFLLMLGLIEVIMPNRIFAVWGKWVSNRYFFLHGLLLICAGLPFTCYGTTVSGILIFIVGLIVVFTGPFILFYSAKVRELFLLSMNDMDETDIRRLIYIDATVRFAVGFLFVYGHGI